MKRSTAILGVLFIVLLAAALLVLQKPGEQSSRSATSGPLVQLDSLAIDRVELKGPSGSVVLEKKGVEWYVTRPVQYHADQAAVASLIHRSKNLLVKSVVSSRPEKQAVFQVDSTGTLARIFENGTEKAAFVVGKLSSSYTDTYVRSVSSNDVVLVDGAFGHEFNRPLREWRDRKITLIPKETIREVQFQYGDTTFTLTFRDSLWTIGGSAVQQSVVNSLIGALSSFQADDFVDSTVMPAPKVNAQISVAGQQIRFAYRKDINKYFVQTSRSSQWFVAEPWTASQILKRKKDLIPTGK